MESFHLTHSLSKSLATESLSKLAEFIKESNGVNFSGYGEVKNMCFKLLELLEKYSECLNVSEDLVKAPELYCVTLRVPKILIDKIDSIIDSQKIKVSRNTFIYGILFKSVNECERTEELNEK